MSTCYGVESEHLTPSTPKQQIVGILMGLLLLFLGIIWINSKWDSRWDGPFVYEYKIIPYIVNGDSLFSVTRTTGRYHKTDLKEFRDFGTVTTNQFLTLTEAKNSIMLASLQIKSYDKNNIVIIR